MALASKKRSWDTDTAAGCLVPTDVGTPSALYIISVCLHARSGDNRETAAALKNDNRRARGGWLFQLHRLLYLQEQEEELG